MIHVNIYVPFQNFIDILSAVILTPIELSLENLYPSFSRSLICFIYLKSFPPTELLIYGEPFLLFDLSIDELYLKRLSPISLKLRNPSIGSLALLFSYYYLITVVIFIFLFNYFYCLFLSSIMSQMIELLINFFS